MKQLTKEEFENLILNSKIIEADGNGPKVYLLTDKTYLKLFRRKKLISTALLFPYSKRFAKNIERLKKLDIKTMTTKEVVSIPHLKATAVHYEALEGRTIRDLGRKSELTEDIVIGLAKFTALLHSKGIIFRSIHLGNVVLTDNNDFGLIDIADMQFRKGELSLFNRKRNFKHMMKTDEDIKMVTSYDNIFIKTYISSVDDKYKEIKIEGLNG